MHPNLNLRGSVKSERAKKSRYEMIRRLSYVRATKKRRFLTFPQPYTSKS